MSSIRHSKLFIITPVKPLIGAISAGGYVASVGNWDGGSESFVGMIITPIAAICGAGIGGIIGVLSDNINNSYLIKKGEWEIIV